MAAYAATVTSSLQRPAPLGDAVGVKIFCGEVNITNYNQTLADITDISGKFQSIFAVIAGSSDSGYVFEWIDASSAFKAYYADYDAVADGALIEVASDTDVGSAHFIAIGI